VPIDVFVPQDLQGRVLALELLLDQPPVRLMAPPTALAPAPLAPAPLDIGPSSSASLTAGAIGQPSPRAAHRTSNSPTVRDPKIREGASISEWVSVNWSECPGRLFHGMVVAVRAESPARRRVALAEQCGATPFGSLTAPRPMAAPATSVFCTERTYR
jgi:hypothetical protein